MEEKDTAQSTICPHCGYEIREEVKFCPQCGEKLTVVNYCPQCGGKAEKGERYCSNCGKDLSRKKPIAPTTMAVTPTLQPIPKRPAGITIVCVLWVLGGLWNFFVGLNNLSADFDVMMDLRRGHYFTDQAVNAWASWAIPIEAVLMLIVMVLGIMQFATIYGFWNRRNWSYKYGIAIPIVAIIINWSVCFFH